eukprot:CAMPEP_0113449774 /NCGR_PEP_ID=MMETSP0014_2-20120614/5479_1 /TAXON_ID=2857 /ORGANISM="Nitzschia sp." /LENGTH=240 /DNA_ID=CAMNT_0000341075 /DNA_START=193 /DNA_END=915 /DNA_ORIENTATION=+ /assembly_acc=CAM_ASM_000159
MSSSNSSSASSSSSASRPITLGIAGGTGAGKTTLARAVFKELGGSANCVYLTHDHYYKDLSHLPPEERAKTNFDHPDSLETDLLVEHIKLLKKGETAVLPTYDFKTHSRTPVTTLVHPKCIIIVEGILLFTHPELCSELDLKVFVDAASDTRVVRRIRRDTVERGRTLDSIMKQYEATVKPMHAAWVEPSKPRADVVINAETDYSQRISVQVLSNHMRAASGLSSINDSDNGDGGGSDDP